MDKASRKDTLNEDRPLRVLWIAQGCSLQDDEENPGLTGRTEGILTAHCGDRIRLALAYMADGLHESRFSQQGIVYYAVDADLRVGISKEEWEKARRELLRIIEDFRPDLIQCFGAEWPYGAIAEAVDLPVVIHMMGFLNIYYLSIHMARGQSGGSIRKSRSLKRRIRYLLRRGRPAEGDEERPAAAERRVMSLNRFFFGRTEWDRNIVRYYSPGSRYYHVPEAVKPCIYNAAGQWVYHCGGRIRLFTLSSADDRKGNEIILRAAEVLKKILGLEIVWRVAGHRDFFPKFELRTGIRHEEVNIELLGMIGGREIIDELKSADFFVHPSIMDNSPHAVCEAQLIGCPVIASNVGGVPDLVEDGKTGFLYPYNEPHTLAFLIANLYREKELLSRISLNEVREAGNRHDPQMIARVMLEAYQSIIADYGHGRE